MFGALICSRIFSSSSSGSCFTTPNSDTASKSLAPRSKVAVEAPTVLDEPLIELILRKGCYSHGGPEWGFRGFTLLCRAFPLLFRQFPLLFLPGPGPKSQENRKTPSKSSEITRKCQTYLNSHRDPPNLHPNLRKSHESAKCTWIPTEIPRI